MIAIDCFHISGRRGLARFTKELVHSLSESDLYREQRESFIFLVRTGDEHLLPASSNHLSLKSTPYPIWQQLAIMRLYGHGLRAYHGLDNSRPIFMPLRSKAIVTVHDLTFLNKGVETTFRNTLGNFWRRINYIHILNSKDSIYSVSDHSAREIEKTAKVVSGIIPPGINLFMAQLPSPVNLPTGKFVLLAGGDAEYKRIQFALHALLGPLKSRGYKVVVVGCSTSYANRLRRETLEEATFLNQISDSELRYLYGASSAVVFPSEVEGFGLPIIEALAHDRGVVVSDLPPMNQILREFTTTYKPGDSDSLLLAIMNVLGAEANETAEKVRNFYRQSMSYGDVYRRFIDG